jgi:hypothetical protein
LPCRAGSEENCRAEYESDREEAESFEQGSSGVIGLLKHSARRKVAAFAVAGTQFAFSPRLHPHCQLT